MEAAVAVVHRGRSHHFFKLQLLGTRSGTRNGGKRFGVLFFVVFVENDEVVKSFELVFVSFQSLTDFSQNEPVS